MQGEKRVGEVGSCSGWGEGRVCSPRGRAERGDLRYYEFFSLAEPGAGGTWGDRKGYKWHYSIDFILTVMRKHWLLFLFV